MRNTLHHLATALAFLAVVVLRGASVSAEQSCPVPGTPEEVEEQASAAFDEGESLFRERDFARARDRFQCSHDLFPHPSTLYNIAQCTEHLGELDSAIEFYRVYLASFPDVDGREEVEARIRELEQRLSPEPEEVSEPVEPEPLDSGDAQDMVTETPEEDAPRARRRLHQGWFWGVLGLSIASAAVMTGTGAATLSLADRWVEEGNVTDRDRALALRTTTDVFLIILVCEAVATTVLGLFTDFGRGRGGEGEETY